MFGVKGHKWLRELELPAEECETVEACVRHVEFLDAEIAQVESKIAKQTLLSPDARRLLTVPGVNVICAATFLAAIGDIRRFKSSRQLVGYLGLDPKVRQSGSSPARRGRISKQGSPQARWALVEAAFSVVRQPGPLHAFYERLHARRGHGVAVVAAARKLAVLFWCLLTRGESYAHQQPSLTAKKLRRLSTSTTPTATSLAQIPNTITPTGPAARRTNSQEAIRRPQRPVRDQSVTRTHPKFRSKRAARPLIFIRHPLRERLRTDSGQCLAGARSERLGRATVDGWYSSGRPRRSRPAVANALALRECLERLFHGHQDRCLDRG
jgi:hypothetical protein